MFDYMLESSPVKRSRQNPWTYFVSLGVQIVILGVMVLIPLLYTEALPKQEMLGWLVAPPPPPPPPPPVAPQPVKRIKRVSMMEAGKLRAPRAIPKEIAIIKEEPLPADEGVGIGGVPGGVPGGQMGGVLGGVLGGLPSAAPPPPEAPKRIRVSTGVQEAKLIRKVLPTFPSIARTARITGTVVLEAIIARDGTIQNLKVVDGHPLLSQAAVDAVSQWRYEPTLLNNEPVEVVTLINVVFRLN